MEMVFVGVIRNPTPIPKLQTKFPDSKLEYDSTPDIAEGHSASLEVKGWVLAGTWDP